MREASESIALIHSHSAVIDEGVRFKRLAPSNRIVFSRVDSEIFQVATAIKISADFTSGSTQRR